MNIYILFILLIHEFSGEILLDRCPTSQQWKLRAQSFCSNVTKYVCLFDRNKRAYKELCAETPSFQRRGYVFVISGNQKVFDEKPCSVSKYQPYKWWTNGSSDCDLIKYTCSGEGQMVFDNGTNIFDRKCRCDYSRWYSFVTTPKNECYCIPSEEDCSCYKRFCPYESVLTPDYQCISPIEWSGNFKCPEINMKRLLGQQFQSGSTLCPFVTPEPESLRRPKDANTAYSIVLVIFCISCLSILAFAKQRKTLRKLNQKFTYQEKNLTDRLQEIENKITTQTVKEERNSDKDEEIQLKTPESKKDEETQLKTPELKKDEETQLKTPESKESAAVGSDVIDGVPLSRQKSKEEDGIDVTDGVPLSMQKSKEEDGIAQIGHYQCFSYAAENEYYSICKDKEQYKIRLLKHYNTIIEDIIPKELINKMEGVLSADDRTDIQRYPCYVGQNRKLVQIVLRHGFEGYQSFLSALNHVDNDKYKYISKKIKNSKVYETETMEMYNTLLEEKVPSHIQDMHNNKLREWKEVDMYLNDAGLDFYANACSILTNKHVVLVTGEPRCGKTLLLQNIALSLSADHDIIPGIHPHDILQYCNPNCKQVFVYDDFCGTPNTDDSLLNQWDQSTYRIQDFLRSGNLKIILSTRSDIYTSLTLKSKRPVFMFLNKNVLRINTPLYDDSC